MATEREYSVIVAHVELADGTVARYVDVAPDGPAGAHINRGLPLSERRWRIRERATDRFGAGYGIRYEEPRWVVY